MNLQKDEELYQKVLHLFKKALHISNAIIFKGNYFSLYYPIIPQTHLPSGRLP